MSIPTSRLLRLSIWLIAPLFPVLPALAQTSAQTGNDGGISGTITDEKQNPVIIAAIVVTADGIQKGSTVTDFDGKYVIKPLAPGRYTVTILYQARKVIVRDVLVTANDLTAVNEKISTSAFFPGCILISRCGPIPPLLDPVHPTRKIQTSAEIERIAR